MNIERLIFSQSETWTSTLLKSCIYNGLSCPPIRPYSAQKFLHARDMHKYESNVFKVLYGPSCTPYMRLRLAKAKQKPVSRVPKAKKSSWEQFGEDRCRNGAKTLCIKNNKSSLIIWLKGYRKWKGGNEKAACLSAGSVEKVSISGS